MYCGSKPFNINYWKTSSTGTEDKTEVLSKCDQIAINIMVSDISIPFINILFCFKKNKLNSYDFNCFLLTTERIRD